MSAGEAAFYHGRMSVAATLFMAIFGMLYIYAALWFIVPMLAFAGIASWHIGNAFYWSMRS